MGSAREPFGQPDCESELRVLKSEYSKLYFDETPFNAAAIEPESYLIIGRRGSGKTALCRYFSFLKSLGTPICIHVDQPAVYQRVMTDVAARSSESRDICIRYLKEIWEYVIWRVVCEETQSFSPTIAASCSDVASSSKGSVSELINNLFECLLELFRDAEGAVVEAGIKRLSDEESLANAKREVLRISAEKPIFITIDTVEKYDIGNDALMNATAALIECAAAFNLDYRDQGIHLKVFISGEVFPYLKEQVLGNPSKSIKNPVYLLWRPKDLLRLISWRFLHYLEGNDLLQPESKGKIDWENHHQVMEKMWRPYFGSEVTNGRGNKERTFAYVLRHTQMRPRQLILLCNAIAKRAVKAGHFPLFTEEDIRLAVKDAETELASEIINSFSSVYPNVSTIVDALVKLPMVFKGNELDKRASQSASEWPDGAYTPARFRRLVAESGIVGRVRRRNDGAGYIDADFEYSLVDRLPITHRDDCVIHPMYYQRLNVELNSPMRVMPFSTEREAREADGD